MRKMLFVAVAAGGVAISCSRPAFVPVAAVSERSVEAVGRFNDTVVWRDSVTVELRGDTVRESRVVWRDRRVVVRDTVRESRVDTVTVVAVAESSSRVGRVMDTAERSLRVGVIFLSAVVFAGLCWRIWRRIRP